ncbi:MAG: hypothetical protein WB607_16555 [Candidatus Acidiferrum sp.]
MRHELVAPKIVDRSPFQVELGIAILVPDQERKTVSAVNTKCLGLRWRMQNRC